MPACRHWLAMEGRASDFSCFVIPPYIAWPYLFAYMYMIYASIKSISCKSDNPIVYQRTCTCVLVILEGGRSNVPVILCLISEMRERGGTYGEVLCVKFYETFFVRLQEFCD